MKKAFLIVSLIVFCQMFAQKKYHFDYALFIESTSINNKNTKEFIYLLNSKLNNYNLFVEDKDSITKSLRLIDENGVYVSSIVSCNEFFKAETFVNSCKETSRYGNPYKYKTKNYDFINFNDTIINDTSYYHYAVKCNKKLKYQKKKKIVTTHYIVEKSSPSYSPFLLHTTVYEMWKISKNIPNGILKLIYYIDTNGKITGKIDVKNVVKIDKYLTIPEECDFTNDTIKNKRPLINFEQLLLKP